LGVSAQEQNCFFIFLCKIIFIKSEDHIVFSVCVGVLDVTCMSTALWMQFQGPPWPFPIKKVNQIQWLQLNLVIFVSDLSYFLQFYSTFS
jgi:hypothetical protein